MRLLNTTTHTVAEFDNQHTIPNYAILSHTWGRQEVSYNDLLHTNTAPTLQGYRKLIDFCSEAARHGFQWVWMDTCCIQKSSSEELAEAVNSMFRWYKNAMVCFVYLADFDVQSKGSLSFADIPPRWFSRGWTLQELLAPMHVVFYDRDWKDIGTKSSLAATIATITGIDPKVLTGENRINQYSIAQKMSWASLRETTRIEDMAYSLLGIFEVNMPLLYGEGWRAFRRLQEEILKNSADQTIFAWRMGWSSAPNQNLSRGILASFPADFRDSGRIICTQNGEMLNLAAYTVTHQGVAIDLRTYQGLGQENFLGVLDCHFIDHPNTRIGLILKTPDIPPLNNLIGPNPMSDVKMMGPSVPPHDLRLTCRRVAQDVLQAVRLEPATAWKSTPLTITPIWEAPDALPPAHTRFPVVDVSLEPRLGESGYSLLRTSSLSLPEESERMMAYIFRANAERADNSFTVQLRWSQTTEEYIKVAIIPGEQSIMYDWTSALNESNTDAERQVGDGDEDKWLVRAKVRPRLVETWKGEILSLFVTVSVVAADAQGPMSEHTPSAILNHMNTN